MKRCIMLFLILMFSLCLTPAFAIPNPSSEFAYVVYDDHAEILGYEGVNPYVEVPSTLEGKPVTYVRLGKSQYEWSNRYTGVKKIVLPDTVKELGEGAFGYYMRLESVIGLDNIERISGRDIFFYCGLREALFSTKLRYVCTDAFNAQLNTITLPDTAEYDMRAFNFTDIGKFTLLRGEGEPTVYMKDDVIFSADGKRLMAILPTMKHVYYQIPEGTEEIDLGALSHSRFLEEVLFPESVQKIYNDGGGLYVLGHPVTVDVYENSYAHEFFIDYINTHPSDAALITVNVIKDGAQETIQDVVDQIVANTITEDMTEIEKARALHNWICDHGTYDYSLSNFHAMDILQNGSGVCDAYASAYCLLLDRAGIQNQKVGCRLNDIDHAINALCIDGKWFYVDCTNDDEGFGNPDYLFGFNDYIFERAGYSLKTGINAETMDYYAPYASGRLESSISELTEAIQSNLGNGLHSFDITLTEHPINVIPGYALCSLVEQQSWYLDNEEYTLHCSTDDGLNYSCYVGNEQENNDNLPLFDYCLNEDRATLTDYRGDKKVVTVPAQIDGYQVYALSNTFKNNTTVEKIILPEGLQEIGQDSFYNCTSLEEISIPSSLQYIGDNAFCGCELLRTDMIFADGLSHVGENAFYGCTTIRRVLLPDTVTMIGESAFTDCTSLRQIELGGVIRLENGLFYGCHNLKQFTIPSSVTSLGEALFVRSGVTNVVIPESVSDIHWAAFIQANNLRSITVSRENPYFAAIDNCLYTKDMKKLICSSEAVPAHLELPLGVEEIGDHAFDMNDALISLHIPSSVRRIGSHSFCFSKVQEVYMEDGVEEIGSYAFAPETTIIGGKKSNYHAEGLGGCLKFIRLSDNLKTIGEGAMFGYHSLGNLVLPCSLQTVDVHFINKKTNLYVPTSIISMAPQPVEYDSGTMVIHGITGSYAETYAADNGYSFVSTDSGILLKDESITLLEGTQAELQVFSINDMVGSEFTDLIEWTSSRPDCVRVDHGIVTAVSMGTATITARYQDYNAFCEVSSVRLANFLGIDVYANSNILRIGESCEMYLGGGILYEEEQDPQYSSIEALADWSVSDPDVLKLSLIPYDNGITSGMEVSVRALNTGRCTVTATMPDGRSDSFEWIVVGARDVDPETCKHYIVSDPAVLHCMEEGLSEGSHCEICGTVLIPQSVLPAVGHAWGEPTYSWSEDNRTVTAIRVCAHDEEHIETETVATMLVLEQAPTETEGGKASYVASFENPAFEEQKKPALDIPAINELSLMQLPSMLKEIGTEAFTRLSCEAVIIPEGCTSIGSRAFAGCSKLVYVRIPASVTDIADDAFADCPLLVIDWVGM